MSSSPNVSEFFSIASEADQLSTQQIDCVRTKTNLHSGPLFSPHTGPLCRATEMVSTLGVNSAKAVILSTPEAEAIGGAGLFTFDVNLGYQFCLPRFHLGPAAQLDMYIAISQLASTSLMKQIIEESEPDNSGIIQFTREGHLANWQVAVWLESGKNLPTTLIKISHQHADNPYARIAHIDGELNLEGFSTHAKTLYICDPIASGMQHVALIEYLERIDRLPQEIVVIAPMATLYGLQVVALSCRKRNITFKAGVLGTLLDSKKPLRYFSPYPTDSNQIANMELARFMQQAVGEQIHNWCIRCNWTASFMGGTQLPTDASQEELIGLGLSNDAVLSIQQTVKHEDAVHAGVEEALIPFSTKLAQKNSLS
jgi:hypothetical protein